MDLKAILFDLDGTLIDTNEQHARAFERGFGECGYEVPLGAITAKIGEGGEYVVRQLIGEEANDRDGDRIRSIHDEQYKVITAEEGVLLLPGAVELLHALRERGFATAVATGSKQESFDHVMQQCPVDFATLADAVTTDTDVEESKPNPDVVEAAAGKLGAAPEECLYVGDTPYDMRAARRAGAHPVAVRTGVHDDGALRSAGAGAIVEDCADLLDRLDEVIGRTPVTGG